jgi:hypothetical protein
MIVESLTRTQSLLKNGKNAPPREILDEALIVIDFASQAGVAGRPRGV